MAKYKPVIKPKKLSVNDFVTYNNVKVKVLGLYGIGLKTVLKLENISGLIHISDVTY